MSGDLEAYVTGKPIQINGAKTTLNILQSFERLFEDEISTDIEVRASERTTDGRSDASTSQVCFNAHYLFIFAPFPQLRKTFAAIGDDGDCYEVTDFSADLVWRFLRWCYTGDYPGPADDEGDDEPRVPGCEDYRCWVILHFDMYRMACTWKIWGLQTTVVNKLYRYWGQLKSAEEEVYEAGREFRQCVRLAFSYEGERHKQLKKVFVDVGARHHAVFLGTGKDALGGNGGGGAPTIGSCWKSIRNTPWACVCVLLNSTEVCN